MSAFEPFEKFDDIETLAEGLSDPDAGTRRVSGDGPRRHRGTRGDSRISPTR